jgi:hypothetical protein
VRLKRDDRPAPQRSRCGEDCCNLSWMMAVIVNDQNAAWFAPNVESPLGASEVPKTCGGLFKGQA